MLFGFSLRKDETVSAHLLDARFGSSFQPCLSVVRHHCTARKLQSEDANAQVPGLTMQTLRMRHAQTCHNISSPLQKGSRYLRVYFYTEGLLYMIYNDIEMYAEYDNAMVIL